METVGRDVRKDPIGVLFLLGAMYRQVCPLAWMVPCYSNRVSQNQGANRQILLYLIPIESSYRGTTMGALSQLIDYPFSRFIPVTYVDRVFFEDMISESKRKKHFQQKLGFDYGLMYTDPSGSNHYLVVLPSVARIIDLTDMIEFYFEDEHQQQSFLAFVERLQQMNKFDFELISDQ